MTNRNSYVSMSLNRDDGVSTQGVERSLGVGICGIKGERVYRKKNVSVPFYLNDPLILKIPWPIFYEREQPGCWSNKKGGLA